jgi:hypothetical protein
VDATRFGGRDAIRLAFDVRDDRAGRDRTNGEYAEKRDSDRKEGVLQQRES